ncbi:MAG TPA: phage tail sheath subtilisin-like domain-containing protein [Blastocatellia bacterium]|nr:phage tail sheath subtilisin-like domain-containing protein [Blastocatellia bacterium]
MMNLRTPGVYIREVEVKPPPRLRMDITGFVGQAVRGPLNFPQPLTSWGEYRDVFGDFVGHGYLPYSVFTFFANGGEKCYVVRVAQESAAKASAYLFQESFEITNQSLTKLKADGVPDAVLVKLEKIKDKRVVGEGRFITLLENTIGVDETFELKSKILKHAEKPPIIHVEAINEGVWGDSIEVVAENTSSDDLIITELEAHLVDSAVAHFKSVRDVLDDETDGVASGSQVKIINPRIPTQQAQVTISNITPADKKVVFTDTLKGEFPAGSRVLGKGFRLTFRYFRNGQLVRGELFDNLSRDPNHERYFVRVINGAQEERDYIKRLRAGSSILVRVTDLCADKACVGLAPQTTNLSEGHDGDPKLVKTSYYTGYEDGTYFPPPPPGKDQEYYGLATYEAVEEIGLVAIPDLIIPDFYDAIDNSPIPEQGIVFAAIPKALQKFDNLKAGQADMLFHCQKMGERFAILDSPRGAEISKGETRIEDWSSNFQLLSDAKYGALYYPWVRQKAADFEGRELFIPPCGHVAGVYSRVEQARGVGKAPANEILRGAVEFEFCLSDGDQAILNPKGINCLRLFPGRGLLVWGARTLSLDALSVYVNIRRVALSIIKNILVNLRWTTFEPNDQELREKIITTLKSFLTNLFESGALVGSKPEEAFFIKCDDETNPQESVDLGRIITQIGFAPAQPAEFILVTIKRSPGALSVLES